MFRRLLLRFVIWGGVAVALLVFSLRTGDVTTASNPAIKAEIQEDSISLYNWPAGSTVTLTIDDPSTVDPIDYMTTLQPAQTDWDPQATYASIQIQGYDLKPGDVVRATDGVITKELVVDFITVDGANLNTDVVWGRAPSGAAVEVQLVCLGQGVCAYRWVTADTNGNWTADFSQAGSRPGEQDIVDITNNHFVEARVSDSDGDFSAFLWVNPYQHISIKTILNINEIHTFNWPLNSTLTLTIDDPNTANDADYTATQTPLPGDWGPGSSIAQFRIEGFTLAPGHIVRITDGNYLREMVIVPLKLTEVDTVNDSIHGTAPPGTPVVVSVDGVCDASGICAQRRVIADANGHWVADFSQPGTGSPGEKITVDLTGGMRGQILVFDTNGDMTALFWWALENRPPEITSLTLSQNILQTGTPLYLTIAFQDPDLQDHHTLMVQWGDGLEDRIEATTSPITLEHRYAEAGIYGIKISIVDAAGATDQGQISVIVYDPDAGFVTGAGKIESPPGSYTPAPNARGRLEVKVNAHYSPIRKDEYVLRGRVEMEFEGEAVEWEFEGTQLDWMVVTNQTAILRGTGVLEQERSEKDEHREEETRRYEFVLLVIDRSKKDNRLLIRIWDATTGEVVYNSTADAPWNPDSALQIEKGYIGIHQQNRYYTEDDD